MLLDPDVFFAPSSVVDSSPLLISIYSFPCRLKMAQKRKCPDDKKPQKPKGDHGGSTHYKQSIGNFKAETMQKCIEEIRRVESTPVPPGTKRPSRSEFSIEADDWEGAVYGTCPCWCTKGQSVRCRYVSSDIDIWGRCRIMSNQ